MSGNHFSVLLGKDINSKPGRSTLYELGILHNFYYLINLISKEIHIVWIRTRLLNYKAIPKPNGQNEVIGNQFLMSIRQSG